MRRPFWLAPSAQSSADLAEASEASRGKSVKDLARHQILQTADVQLTTFRRRIDVMIATT
jgi:hypothetical protein